MTTSTAAILSQANERAQAEQLPYAGAVTAIQAYDLLKNNTNIKLVDVRTNAERDWVGKVDIPANQHLAVEWNQYPGGQPNAAFVSQLTQLADKDTILLFLCRSGVRSRHSAKLATDNGFTQCYDILGGFEGNKDSQGHRKTVDGWCKDQLPWIGA